MRTCWSAAPLPPEPGPRELVPVGPGRRDAAPARRTFVPVDAPEPVDALEPAPVIYAPLADPTTADESSTGARSISPVTGSGRRIPGTWWLWGDPEPWPET